jgi:non-homologous end joining protein Ku
MFSGSISLGLVNVPITIAKAWGDEREGSLKQVCSCHKKPIDASWRCSVSMERCTDTVSAVQISDDEWRVISTDEMGKIEDATNSKVLEVLDVQPLARLPLLYATGCYFIRHDDKAKMRPEAMATLVASMTKAKVGLVVKWGNSTREKLCVIAAERGVLTLRVIPFWSGVRVPSKKERAHFSVKLKPRNVAKMDELLGALSNPEGFQYAEYQDEGLALRQAAVERILDGEEPVQRKAPEKIEEEDIDIFEMIDRAVAEVKA